MTKPKLYIIMREDLWGMSPAKGMAQASHATSAFENYDYYDDFSFQSAVADWSEDRKFGTTIILTAHVNEFEGIINSTKYNGIVTDESYPYENYYGKKFTCEVTTCMWVFATTDQELEYMKQWRLHQ